MVIGFGLRGFLGLVPQPAQDRNCLDAVDAPIAVVLDKTIVRATAHHFGPGWIIIPEHGAAPQ
jgi:hypothetical protein